VKKVVYRVSNVFPTILQTGRPRNRWRDEVLKDIRVLGVKYLTKVVMDRCAWHESGEEFENSQKVVRRKMKNPRCGLYKWSYIDSFHMPYSC
jgi:hypothetical protein